jgi:hypothetical protein
MVLYILVWRNKYISCDDSFAKAHEFIKRALDLHIEHVALQMSEEKFMVYDTLHCIVVKESSSSDKVRYVGETGQSVETRNYTNNQHGM